MVWRLQEGHNSVPKYILCSVVNTLFAIHLVQRVLYIQAYKHHIFLPHTDCKSISKLSYCWMEAKCIPSFISLPLSSIGDSAAHLISLRAKHTAAAAAKSLQLCPTLCDPIDGSPLGYSVPGILQARILEWVAISFSNAWKWKVKVKSLSCAWLLATPWTGTYQALPFMGFSRQEYWSGVPLPSLAKHTRTRYFYVSLRNKAGVLQLYGWEKNIPRKNNAARILLNPCQWTALLFPVFQQLHIWSRPMWNSILSNGTQSAM